MYCIVQLPSAQGKVTKALDTRATTGEQRTHAQAFFDFFDNPQNDFRDLNREGNTVFTAMVVVPDSHKVKVIYGLGISTAGIGRKLVSR